MGGAVWLRVHNVETGLKQRNSGRNREIELRQLRVLVMKGVARGVFTWMGSQIVLFLCKLVHCASACVYEFGCM